MSKENISLEVMKWLAIHADEYRIGKYPNFLFALEAKYERETGKEACLDGDIPMWTDDFNDWEVRYFENAIKNAGTEIPGRIARQIIAALRSED